MASEKLIVKNFGPIREAEIDLRKVTVFIGEQASGKSVLAKLVEIFNNVKYGSAGSYISSFIDLNIYNFITDETYISFQNKFHKIKFVTTQVIINKIK
jgi:predicted ATPase